MTRVGSRTSIGHARAGLGVAEPPEQFNERDYREIGGGACHPGFPDAPHVGVRTYNAWLRLSRSESPTQAGASARIARQLLFARDREEHHAPGRLKILSRERLDRLCAGGAVPLDVLPQVVRCSEVVLVAVQPIGLAVEPAERFEAGNDPCLDGVPAAFELAGVGSGVREAAELFVDGRLECLGRVAAGITSAPPTRFPDAPVSRISSST